MARGAPPVDYRVARILLRSFVPVARSFLVKRRFLIGRLGSPAPLRRSEVGIADE
jgi:hypothetical protein